MNPWEFNQLSTVTTKLAHLYAGYFKTVVEAFGSEPMAMELSATTETLLSISRLTKGSVVLQYEELLRTGKVIFGL